MSKIRLVLVDDHPIVREGIRMVLENDEAIDVVGEAESIEQALALIAESMPDLILLDIDLGIVSSLDHLAEITAAAPGSRILLLTGLNDEEANRRGDGWRGTRPAAQNPCLGYAADRRKKSPRRRGLV